MGSGNPIPEIDLTCSSPEPESSRRPAQRLKTERHASQPTPVTSKLPIRPATIKTEAGRDPGNIQKLISPVHLERLIDTTDREAIKTVLLQLCEVSPAFSGALARGLAPHSRFARGLVPPRDHGRSRVALEGSTTPSPRPLSERIPTPYALRTSSVLRQSVTDDDGSSPETSNLPGRFPRSPFFASPRPPTLAGTPRPAPIKVESTSGPSSSSRTPPTQVTTTPPSNPIGKDNGAILDCDNCDLLYFENSPETCLFHPGQLKTVDNGDGRRTREYTCCKGGPEAAPCREENHVSTKNDDTDSLKRVRRPSEASPLRLGKNPRLL